MRELGEETFTLLHALHIGLKTARQSLCQFVARDIVRRLRRKQLRAINVVVAGRLEPLELGLRPVATKLLVVDGLHDSRHAIIVYLTNTLNLHMNVLALADAAVSRTRHTLAVRSGNWLSVNRTLATLIVHDDLLEWVPVGLTREETVAAEELFRDLHAVPTLRRRRLEALERVLRARRTVPSERNLLTHATAGLVVCCVQVPRDRRLGQVETACRSET